MGRARCNCLPKPGLRPCAYCAPIKAWYRYIKEKYGTKSKRKIK